MTRQQGDEENDQEDDLARVMDEDNPLLAAYADARRVYLLNGTETAVVVQGCVKKEDIIIPFNELDVDIFQSAPPSDDGKGGRAGRKQMQKMKKFPSNRETATTI